MKFLDYIQGLRKGKDAHRIEQDAMSDPFLSDAIDGYDSVAGNHSERIAGMQARIIRRTAPERQKSGAWKIAVAAVAFIALLGGYFALMNHEASMMAAHESDSSDITIYAPEDYIDRRNLELAEMKDAGKDTRVNALVYIVNLHEVIKPVERISIYMPEVYYAQLNQKEREELSAEKRRMAEDNSTSMLAYNNTPSGEVDYAREVSNDVSENAPFAEAAGADKFFAENYDKMEKVTSPEPPLLMPPATAKEDSYMARRSSGNTLRGKVVDENNEPLIGVTVKAKGSNKGTATDLDGNYQLYLDSAADADLIAQYMGYETIEIPNAKDNQVIAMKESRQLLDEVVVVGYGAQKKSAVTGSVATVQSEEPVKTKPKPVIGSKEYSKYLEANLIKPVNADGCKNGKVVVEFNVNTSGRPVNIKVIKALCEAYNKEAIRLVEAGPDWIYGTERVKIEVKF